MLYLAMERQAYLFAQLYEVSGSPVGLKKTLDWHKNEFLQLNPKSPQGNTRFILFCTDTAAYLDENEFLQLCIETHKRPQANNGFVKMKVISECTVGVVADANAIYL